MYVHTNSNLQFYALPHSKLFMINLKGQHERSWIIVIDVLDRAIIFRVDALQVVICDGQTDNMLRHSRNSKTDSA